MSGSVLFAVIAFVLLLIVTIFASPWFLIPALFVGVFALLASPVMGALKNSGGAREGSGTPSTSEASYTPAGSGSERPI